MSEFIQLRPDAFYANFLEFVRLGFKPEFINIYLGFVIIIVAGLCVLKSRQNIHIKLLALYFSLSFFTNFAYQMYGARIFDFIGIAISLVVILILLMHKLKIWQFEKILIVLTAVLLFHILILYLLGYLDKYESGNSIFLQRLVMICRLGVLFFVFVYFTNFVKTENHIDFIVTTFKYVALAALSIMLFQEVLFFGFGFRTVGTYTATSQIPVPRFGSVAIEGGHFGKLMPTFLVYFLAQGKFGLKVTVFFMLLLLLSLTNISASFYGYVVFIFLSMLIVNTLVFKIQRLKIFLTLVIAGVFAIIAWFYDYVLLFLQKVLGLLFHYGDKFDYVTYRSPEFLYKSLAEFPLGIGFGVNNRFLPDGSFTSLGIYGLISQLSILSIIVLFCFFYYWLFTIKYFIKYKQRLINKAYAGHSLIMVLAVPLMFFSNIVWLYPGYILPFLILAVYLKKEKLERLGRTQEPSLIYK